MTDYTKRSEDEAKTYELFAEALDRKWSVERGLICKVFRMEWHSALDVPYITKVANAVSSYANDFDFQKELTSLVREKVLRSRVEGGERLYEVNY